LEYEDVTLTKIDSLVDSGMDGVLMDLQTLIRQPSVSARREGLLKCANLVLHLMQRAGIHTELLYLNCPKTKGSVSSSSFIPPIVYGEVKSKSNPNGKTILFYNHYDVQPEDPVELWDEDPFSGKVDGNYIFGRGAADDKGELITRIKAVEFYLKIIGDVPCNIKFIIEGEEEVGSPHLNEYLRLFSNKFKCHGIIWESGFIDTYGRPIISLGQKGILSVEISVKGPSRDAHSSLAVIIENPAWRLIKLLNTLRDATGKILINGWYNEARDFTDEEISLITTEPFDEEALKKDYNIDNFLNNVSGIEAKKAFAGTSTCNISGLLSDYTGSGSKTVVPAIATARLDFRLVPNMIPEIQYRRLVEHFKDRVSDRDCCNGNNIVGGKDVEIRFLEGEPPSRTQANQQFVDVVREAATEIYGSVIVNVSSAGTGPMYYFDKILHAPSVCVGSTDLANRNHSPNEYIRIDQLNKTIKCIVTILEKFASSKK
jgi:acetylornithine deacetylase/succinyl-diaminopimelate desuccinylase-like protein